MAFASFGAFNKKPKPKRKRCGDCAGCLVVDDCNQCKYCLDKPRNGGSNTLRRQCMKRECANAEGLGLEDAEISPYTLDCLSQAIAHGKLVCGHTGSDEENDAIATPNKKARKDEGPPSPVTINGKRTYTKDAPGRPTHTTYQKAVMSRFYELNKLPDVAEREALSKALNLTPRAVQVWFQNRRQRQKADDKNNGIVSEFENSAGQGGLPMPSAPNNKNGIGSWYHTDLSGGMQMSTTAAAAEALKRANNKAKSPPPFAPVVDVDEENADDSTMPIAIAEPVTDEVLGFSEAIGTIGTPPPSAKPMVETGYGNVLLEAYANLPASSRAALPSHALKLVINAYMAMPDKTRAKLQPHVQEFVEAAMYRSRRADDMRLAQEIRENKEIRAALEAERTDDGCSTSGSEKGFDPVA